MTGGGEKRKYADEELQGTVVTTPEDQQMVLSKKARTEEQDGTLVAIDAKQQSLVASSSAAPPRTSSLQAATMCLTGHGGAVHACKFNPTGTQIASGGADKLLFLWDLAETGECTNTAALAGHDATILDLAWNGAESVLTASADKTAAVWDVERGERIKRIRGHHGIVNSIGVTRRGQPSAVTASDDCTVKVWDLRARQHVQQFVDHYQVLAATFSDDATQIFSAGISNDIKCWDVRTGKLVYSLVSHRDSVTGLALSPDGSYLLSNGMDSTLRCWDVRPYVSAPTRQTMVYKGATHDMEQNLLRCSWSPDGLKVSGGSADRAVNVWEAATGRILYRLPGHQGCVNDVQFHTTEPIILSAASDKKMWIGELY